MSTEATNTNPDAAGFLFKRPDYVDTLGLGPNIALAFGAFASRMTQELRTRTIHPDGRRENVAEHGYMLAKVAVALADALYPHLDRGRIAIHAINHDDPEAYVGDTPTDSLANHDPRLKAELEAEGVEQLVAEYAPLLPHYVDDLVTYEEQEELEAQFVRIVDKMMVSLIHIPNNGETLRAFYTREQCIESAYEAEQKLFAQYPHFRELIEMRTELAVYVIEECFSDATRRTDA